MNFKTYLKAQGLSKSTAKHYLSYSLDFISFLDKQQIETEQATSQEVVKYLAKLQQKGNQKITRKIRLYALKYYFDFEIQLKRRIDNPAKHIKLKGKQEQKLSLVLTKQELQAIYENYKVPKEDDAKRHYNWFKNYRLSKARNKVIISLLIHQGITTAEVNRILIDDLDLRKGEIHIRGGRIGKDRILKLKSSQIMDLMDYQFKTRNELLKYQKPDSSLREEAKGRWDKKLFLAVPSAGKQKVSTKGNLQIWKGLSKAIKAENPKFINMQHIRKSVIVHWLKTDNLREVQYKAGHRNIYSTEMYLVNAIDDLQASIIKHHPIG